MPSYTRADLQCCPQADLKSVQKVTAEAPKEARDEWNVCLQHHHWNKSMTIAVNRYWTVYDMKKFFQALTGVPYEQQQLTFAGCCLHIHLCISETGMFDGCFIKLVVKLSAKSKWLQKHSSLINITVKTLKGRKPELWVETGWTVHQLKELICQILGPAPDHQRLIFAGQQLQSAHSLHDYCISKGYVLHLVLKVTQD